MTANDSLSGMAIAEYLGTVFDDPVKSDEFFGKYTIGNALQTIDQPFERFRHYENFMRGLRLLDRTKYEQMHRGTPFFYMAWLSFDMRNFEKALFYLDTAIADDVRNAAAWQDLPGVAFLKLNTNNVAARTVAELRKILGTEMERFNRISGRTPLTIDNWGQHFVETLITTPARRTILCSVYIFLYEFQDRLRELELRGGVGGGGSNHPFLSHLLLGGLIFESLLKQFYVGDTLNSLFNLLKADPGFNIPVATVMPTSANVPNPLAAILAAANATDIVTAFTTTGKLRNTTGHNLDRDNIFDQPANYVTLFQQVVNAIFYVISVKYVP
jgi:hypothetical protein